TDRRRESVTVTAKVAGGLPVQTQSKATQFYQYANLTITGLVNNGCTVTCTVTVNAHAQDIDGNPLSGLSVGSQSPTYGGGSTGFTLPPTDASGNAAIQRPMTTAAVDTGVYVFADAAHNAGVIPATRAGAFTSEYRSATTTVTTSAPYTRVIWTYVAPTNVLATQATRSITTSQIYTGTYTHTGSQCGKTLNAITNQQPYPGVSCASMGYPQPWVDSPGVILQAGGPPNGNCISDGYTPSCSEGAVTPATYTKQDIKWDCRSDVNPSGSAPGALPANCVDISPASSAVANQTNTSPGWTHTP
ncbi:hypothetical protein, partial [Citrobacter meridianamericanus]